jgi:twitching motility two-component system response regulator PilH
MTTMRTILLVEDSLTELAMVGDCLRGAGYAVLTAADGAQAQAQMDHGPIDLIVMDLILPDINGYDLFRAFQRDTRTGATPVVMLTQRVSMPEEYYGRTLGAAAYLKKPFRADLLLHEAHRLAPLD